MAREPLTAEEIIEELGALRYQGRSIIQDIALLIKEIGAVHDLNEFLKPDLCRCSCGGIMRLNLKGDVYLPTVKDKHIPKFFPCLVGPCGFSPGQIPETVCRLSQVPVIISCQAGKGCMLTDTQPQ